MLRSSQLPIEGIHVHTNADSTDFGELLANVRVLTDYIPAHSNLKWINLGGGYLFEDVPLHQFVEAINAAHTHFGAEVVIEPGAGLVRSAGYLVASVLDVFVVDGEQIAVLDATVNHMPEVLEFDYSLTVTQHQDNGQFAYTLAGSTCLAGDVFGRYRFPMPLRVGSKLIFEEAGAYTLAKAHRFNGINLPLMAILGADGEIRVRKTFEYLEFATYWGTND